MLASQSYVCSMQNENICRTLFLCFHLNSWLMETWPDVVVCVLCSCFERFFKQVNLKENKLQPKRRGGCLMDDMELIGLDYVWRVGCGFSDLLPYSYTLLARPCRLCVVISLVGLGCPQLVDQHLNRQFHSKFAFELTRWESMYGVYLFKLFCGVTGSSVRMVKKTT